MSDRSSDRALDLIIENLQSIQKKIESAPALNGGFDKLVVAVDNMNEKQKEAVEKISQIQQILYEPDSGFFARVKTVEDNNTQVTHDFETHQVEDAAFHNKLADQVATETKVLAVTNQLTKVAGKDLEELEAVIKLKKTLKRIIWIISAGILTEFGRIIFEYFK